MHDTPPVSRWLVLALFVGTALAASALKLAPVALSSLLQVKLRDTYGVAEGPVLQNDVSNQLSPVIAKGCGADAVTLEVEIMVADSSHPTRKQLSDNPSIDFMKSKFIGGARLVGRLRAAEGALLQTVEYGYYPPTMRLASASASAWSDAHIAIGQFADKIAALCRSRSGAS